MGLFTSSTLYDGTFFTTVFYPAQPAADMQKRKRCTDVTFFIFTVPLGPVIIPECAEPIFTKFSV